MEYTITEKNLDDIHEKYFSNNSFRDKDLSNIWSEEDSMDEKLSFKSFNERRKIFFDKDSLWLLKNFFYYLFIYLLYGIN